MTLRLALLFVSLLLLGLIGLFCHIKYRQLHPKKRLKTASVSEADALIDEDINAPFINENIISDIPETDTSLFDSVTKDEQQTIESPELKTSLDELVDYKHVEESIVSGLLPVYSVDDLIFEQVAVLPNVNMTVKEVKPIVESQIAKFDKDVEILVQLKKENEFVPLAPTRRRQKITHLKCTFKFRQKKGITDSQSIKDFETFIQGMSKQLSCSQYFALTTEEAVTARDKLNDFIKAHDLIIILYILAKPEDSFSGQDLKKTVTDCGLEFGEFKFYHYFSQSGENRHQKLFSLANMYKPGSFDQRSLDEFSTMGICLFMVPALINDPIAGFSEMCTHAKQIADGLSGVLTTNQRELLDENNYKLICAKINEHTEKLTEQGIKPGDAKAFELFA